MHVRTWLIRTYRTDLNKKKYINGRRSGIGYAIRLTHQRTFKRTSIPSQIQLIPEPHFAEGKSSLIYVDALPIRKHLVSKTDNKRRFKFANYSIWEADIL